MRSLDPSSDSAIMGSDTAVAVARKNVSDTSTSQDTQAGEEPSTNHSGKTSVEIVGTTLSERYLVTKKIGQGGMGAVYEATHTLIGKRVAVKVLLEKYAQREAIVKRLKQEAQLASSIGNEHIIDITDFGTTQDGRTFVVMEFLEGESLAECLSRETSLGEQRILRIISQAASALAAAHAKGIVHRDIKPENLFLLRRKDNDFVKVVDFGISKSLRASSEEEETTRLTQTGMVLGTPLYMSPEQARGDEELDHRVDVYALGVIMYECSTGHVPFVGNNYLSVISQVLNEDPRSLREQKPEFSEEFEAVVGKAMAKDVSERYASANDMLADLNALLEDPTHSTERAKITGPRRRLGKKPDVSIRLIAWIAGIAVVLAAIVFSVTQLVSSSKKSNGEGSGSQVIVTPAAVDAGVALATDAAPVVEPVKNEVIQVRIESTPPGAVVYLDGFEQTGTTPLDAEVVKKDKDIKLTGQLEGYKEYELQFNPLTLKAGKDGTIIIPFKLQKAPKGTKFTRPPKPPEAGSGTGSGTTPKDKTGGELGGDPYGTGGTVPKP
ncbi:MAG: protein kinase domain-containing protein [Kofleriaceae bacterium]